MRTSRRLRKILAIFNFNEMERRTYLFLIPARGGSKGIPNKNIKDLLGKPLIQYTIDEAKKIANIDDICLSTDSANIKRVGESLGLKVPFLRPSGISQDLSSTEEVLRHALKFYEENGIHYEYVVLLQPTSPFRKEEDVLKATSLMSNEMDMVVSVKMTASNPYYVLFEENKYGFLEKSKEGDFTRRQDCPAVYELNGAIYVINVKSLKSHSMKDFKRIVKYEMGEVESLDIDEPIDWLMAELILKENLI